MEIWTNKQEYWVRVKGMLIEISRSRFLCHLNFGQVFQMFSQCPHWASLLAQLVKNLPTMHETLVWFLGWEDPLEKETATYSSILACRIPWTEELGRLQSMGSQRVRHNWTTFTFIVKLKQMPTSRSFEA